MQKNLVFALRHIGKSRPGQGGFRLFVERLHIARGELLALVGPSGCGKSTTLDILACALHPDTEIHLPDHPVAESMFLFRPMPEIIIDVLAAWGTGGTNALAQARLHFLGYVLQTGGLLPFLTAGENIFLRCKCLGVLSLRKARILDIVDRLGIGRLLGQYPSNLSVGERQRVAIATALAHEPAVILADEPTAALDPAQATNVMQIFCELTRKMGITVIMVTHDLQLARESGFNMARVEIVSGREGSAGIINYAKDEG